jgi:membrane protease YdiL (CAAX protease family)
VPGLLITNIGIYTTLALITLSCAQVRSLRGFIQQFGFQKPRLYAACGAAIAGASLAGLGFIFIKSGMAPPQNKMLQQFADLGHGGLHASHWLMLIAPFTEEILLRGYFYKAFRESYTVPVSVGCVLGMVVLTHYSAMFSSLLGFVALSSLNIIASLLRERYESIWNCILCHFAYNCVLVFV